MKRILILTVSAILTCSLAAGATAAMLHQTAYDTYACTLQGTPHLTYVVESDNDSTLITLCRGLESVLSQSELRWGLHSPSFSSGETPQATWQAPKFKTKITMLSLKVPALPPLIRAVGSILSPSVWHRTGISYP